MAIETYKLASGAVRYRATTYTENPTWIRENLLDFLSACEKENNIMAPPLPTPRLHWHQSRRIDCIKMVRLQQHA